MSRRCRRLYRILCGLVGCCVAVAVVLQLLSYQYWVVAAGSRVASLMREMSSDKYAKSHRGQLGDCLHTVVTTRQNTSLVTSRTVSGMNDVGSARQTGLDDVFISVKTTGKYHSTRVKLLLVTWLTVAQNQTYIFTDTDDEALNKSTGGHVINTQCSSDHMRPGLCCKMSSEFDFFILSKKRWFCHVDDDTYVNVVALVKLLRQYPHNQDWYIGKPSLARPLKVTLRHPPETVSFWFATGGAGFCLSRSLALKMVPYVSMVGETDAFPRTSLWGVLMQGDHYLHLNLTVIRQFSSHLDHLPSIHVDELPSQISLSYIAVRRLNVVQVPGFNTTYDPSRFLSVHCALFPHNGCPVLNSTKLPSSWTEDKFDVLETLQYSDYLIAS